MSKPRVVQSRLWRKDELPEDVQREHEWAEADEEFVRYVYTNGNVDFIPMENFMRIESTLPSGLYADGFAVDSYFSGTALRYLELDGEREPMESSDTLDVIECEGDPDCELWIECW